MSTCILSNLDDGDKSMIDFPPEILKSLETSFTAIECLHTKNKPRVKEPSILNSDHITPIINRKWKEVLSWAAFHPDEVSNLRDNHNQTILHHACLFKAPYDIIEALLFADSSGLLSSVINDDGEFAIHWAVRVSSSAHVLKTLITSNPRSGFMIDKHGDSAFSLLWDRNRKAIRSFVFDGLRSDVLIDDTLLLRSRFEFLWNKNQFSVGTMMMLLRSYCCGNTDDKPFLPLHAVAGNPQMPFSFFTFIAKVYHDDIRKRDDRGRYPLAVACSCIDANVDVINFLLSLDPDSPTMSDYQDRYPLFLAVEAGLPWDMCVQSIFNAAPHILSMRDTSTGLYPFMLAAVAKSNSIYDTEQSELNCLNAAFFLLLKDPECVRLRKY